MTAILLFLFFLFCGILIAHHLFHEYHPAIRIWAGLTLGVLSLMWAPIPFAFFWGFSVLAHGLAVVLMGPLTLLITRLIPLSKNQNNGPKPTFPSAFHITIVLFSAICSTLLFQQIFLPKDGALFVGPSTYGDLPVHSAIITTIAEHQTFPPENPVYSGHKLTYPFLADSLCSTFLLFGLNLRWAILVPSFLFIVLVLTGFLIFAYEILKRTAAAILAALLFFFSGGLGFIYFIEKLKISPDNFTRLFHGYSVTPTNIGDQNIYMWNVICHILIPQRTSLTGWSILFFVLWVLYRGLSTQHKKYFLISGIITGLMPIIHTPSYFILIVIGIFWFLAFLFTSQNKKGYLENWLYWLLPLLLLSIPQNYYWFASEASAPSFFRFKWNAFNIHDNWFWFWIKNGGVVFVLSIPALIGISRKNFQFYVPAIILFLVAEAILFAPWTADNNKIFFIWYAFSVILVSGYIFELFDLLNIRRERWVLIAMITFLGTFSGILSVCHDFTVSNQINSNTDLAVADYVRYKTPKDAIFLTAAIHNNPVSTLAGRRRLMGLPAILNSHGINFKKREKDIIAMYRNPKKFPLLADRYHVDYIYFSDTERGMYKTDNAYFEQAYPKTFSYRDVNIYAISNRAKNYQPKGF